MIEVTDNAVTELKNALKENDGPCVRIYIAGYG